MLDRQTKAPLNANGWRIIVAGVGGQGVLTSAYLLRDFFVDRGHQVVSSQLHGMAQRSGGVQTSVMVDCGISPVVAAGKADFILGFEPVETVRALSLISAHTTVFMNTSPVVPFTIGQSHILGVGQASYPDLQELTTSLRSLSPKLYCFDASNKANEVGSIKALNMVMLGCLFGGEVIPYSADDFWQVISATMPATFAESNRQAFVSGADYGKSCGVSED